jgi:hypothetical protein
MGPIDVRRAATSAGADRPSPRFDVAARPPDRLYEKADRRKIDPPSARFFSIGPQPAVLLSAL